MDIKKPKGTFESLYLKFESDRCTDQNDFNNFYSYVLEISPSERQENMGIISTILIILLSKIENDSKEEPSIKEKIVELVEIIAVTEGICTSQHVFFTFLYKLLKKENKGNGNSSDIVKQYKEFEDIINDVSWLFTLKSQDNNYLFPIHDLVLDLVTNFYVDNDHLIHLAIVLQLYNRISNLESISRDADGIRSKIAELSAEYKVECLNYLINGGKIIRKSELDYFENGTLIFQNNNKVLIRNISQDYFSVEGRREEVYSELDSQGQVMASFCEFELDKGVSLVSFDYIMKNSPERVKRLVVKEIFDTHNYNTLLNECFIVNSTDGEFCGFVNPFGSNDKKIIYSDKNESINLSIISTSRSLISIIKNNTNGLRETILIRTGANILTLDFVITFYSEVMEYNHKFPILDFHNTEEIYQNKIIQTFFEEIQSKRDIELFQSTLFSYYKFLKKYILDNDNIAKQMDERMALVMPYDFFLPVESSLTIFKEKMKIIGIETSGINIHKIGVEKTPETNFYLHNFDREETFDGLSLDLEPLEEYGFPDEITFHALVDEANKLFYYDEDEMKFIEAMDILLRWKQNAVLNTQSISSIYAREFESIVEIISMIKLNEYNYKVLGSTIRNGHFSIIAFKVLWQFQIFRWNKDKIAVFFDLVLNKHFTGSVLNYQENVDAWLGKVEKAIASDGVLVIQKENSENQGTLDFFIWDYVTKLGTKKYFDQMQSSSFIISNLSFTENEAYFKNNRITDIIFLTDNIMGGASTKKMLQYYLEKSVKDKHSQYLNISNELIRVLKISDSINIKVWSMWGYAKGVNSIQEKFPNISVIIEKEIPQTYMITEEIKHSVKELYGSKLDYNFPEYLVIRANNMPSKSVFPKKYTDTLMLVGLFNRKEEK